MKNYLLLILSLFFIQVAFSQNLYFNKDNYLDSSRFSKAIPQLAKNLIKKYKESDKPLYYLNLGYIQIAAELYNEVPHSMTAYGIAKYGDSISTKDLGFPYRVYSLTMTAKPEVGEFKTLYESKFMSLYNDLSPNLKNYIDGYFKRKLPELKKKLEENLKSLSQKDSLTNQEALSIIQDFSNYKVFHSTLDIATKLLQKIDDQTYIVNDSVLVKMPDGGTIALTVVRSRSVTQALPVVLKYNIYAGNDIADCKDAVQRGYIGITANTRGKRLSPDAIEPFEHDAKDSYYIIDWISRQKWCNGSIGMYGGSYLGFSQWSAVKHLHPALKTIVPLVSVGAGVDYPMLNNVFMSFCLRWIHYVTNNKLIDRDEFADAKRWGTLFNTWYKKGGSFASLDTLDGRPNPIFQRWLKHPSYDDYWKSMTPQNEDYSKINIPILSTTGYFDDDQTGAMYYYKQYHKWNKNPNYYLIIGPYTHGGSQAFPELEVGGYKIDSVANIPILDIIYEWFDHTLKGKPMPSILKDKVNFEVMGENKWMHVSSISQMANDTLKFYLSNKAIHKKYALVKNKPLKLAFISQKIDLAKRELLEENYDVNKSNTIVDTMLKSKPEHLVFISQPIEKPFAISGSFRASIKASINKKDVDLYIQLYEKTPDGKYMAFDENYQRASYSKDRSKRQLLTPEKPTLINISNTYITCKKLQKHSQIIVVIGVNKSPNWQINYGTGKDVSIESIKDAAIPLNIKWFNSSWIKIPVLK